MAPNPPVCYVYLHLYTYTVIAGVPHPCALFAQGGFHNHLNHGSKPAELTSNDSPE